MEELLEAEERYEEALEYAAKLSHALEEHPETDYESDFDNPSIPMTEEKAKIESELYIQLYSTLMPYRLSDSQLLMYDAGEKLYDPEKEDFEDREQLIEQKNTLEEKQDDLMDLAEDLAVETYKVIGKDIFNSEPRLEPVGNTRIKAAD